MDRIENMQIDPQWLGLEIRLNLLWAEVAREQGADGVTTALYLARKVTGYDWHNDGGK